MLDVKVFMKTENYSQSSHGNLGPADPTARTNRTRSSHFNIVENRTSAYEKKSFYKPRLRQGFVR